MRFVCYPQGGGVAAAFTAHFPHLVDNKIVLIASAGLIEVQIMFSCKASSARY